MREIEVSVFMSDLHLCLYRIFILQCAIHLFTFVTNCNVIPITARFPTHAASKWLDHSEEHKNDIEKLRSMDGDFHHGFNSGMLAAARLFKDHAEAAVEADAEHIQEAEPVIKENIEESKKVFPNLSVNEFPAVRST